MYDDTAESILGSSTRRMNVMTKSKIPRQKPDYVLETLDNEMILYHPGRNQALYLNETASLIWRLCDGNRTSTEIAELLQEAFPEQEARIGDEVETTLQRFVEEDAVELV